jgi:hypothetical protein
MADVTNTSYDAKISSESATVTRVTDIDNDFPATNNSHIPVKCTTDNGNTVYINYDDLSVTANWTKQVAIADGGTAKILAMQTVLAAQDSAITGYGTPITPTEYQAVVAALKVKNDMDPIQGN